MSGLYDDHCLSIKQLLALVSLIMCARSRDRVLVLKPVNFRLYFLLYSLASVSAFSGITLTPCRDGNGHGHDRS